MNPAPGKGWSPPRELLAAFADGELDGCGDVAELRRRIEDWLLLHPDARAEADAQTDVSSLMAATSPAEPDGSVWAQVWPRIERGCKSRTVRRSAALGFAFVLAAGAAAAVLLVGLYRGPESQLSHGHQVNHKEEVPARGNPQIAALPAPPTVTMMVPGTSKSTTSDSMAVLPVATNDDVEIIRVVGADPRMLVVGRLPWSGPLALLKAHEVQVKPPHDCLTCMGSGSTPILMMPLSDDMDDNK